MLSPQDEEFLKEMDHAKTSFEYETLGFTVRKLLRIVAELKSENTRLMEKDALYRNFPSDESMQKVMKERDGLREELNKQAQWYERNSTPKF